MNVVMLLLAIRLSGGRVRWGRVLAAGLLGALAAQGTRMMALSRGMTTALWLPMAVGMMAVACGRPALRRPLHYGGLLLCAAGLLGGVVLALSGAPLWLPMAVGMMAVACGRPALRRPLHYGGLLLCAAGLLGGVVLALSGALTGRF